MAKKKGFWKTLLGDMSGGCSCDTKLTEEASKKKNGCCDMQIVEDADDEVVADHKTTE